MKKNIELNRIREILHTRIDEMELGELDFMSAYIFFQALMKVSEYVDNIEELSIAVLTVFIVGEAEREVYGESKIPEEDLREVGQIIAKTVENIDDESKLKELKKCSLKLCEKYPLY